MPIIGTVGRRSLKIRLLDLSLHLILILGAVTMIYPFLIMIAGSFKSAVDSRQFSVWPKYFTDDTVLFCKYVEARYNELTAEMQGAYHDRFPSFEFVRPPENPVEQRVVDWRAFLAEQGEGHGVFDYLIAEQSGRGIYPRNNRAFGSALKREAGGSIEELNRTYGTTILTWDEVNSQMSVTRAILDRRFNGNYKGILARYLEFAADLPVWHRVYPSLDGDFVQRELKQAYGGDLDRLNRELGTHYATWQNPRLAGRVPDGPLRKHWVNYVRELLNVSHLALAEGAASSYRAFLGERYGSIEALNRVYGTSYPSWDSLPLATAAPAEGDARNDWEIFATGIVADEHLVIAGAEFDYRDWLRARYQDDLAALNEAHRTGYAGFTEVRLSPEAPEHNRPMLVDWLAFLRTAADPASIRVSASAQKEFVEFLSGSLPTADGQLDVEALNRMSGTRYRTPADVYPPASQPANEAYRAHWLRFVREAVRPQHLRLDETAQQGAWQAFLERRHGSVAELNAAYGMTWSSFDDVSPDHWTSDWFTFRENRRTIMREFVKRNYVMVMSVMLYNGRAIFKTLFYCMLAIATALLINPIGAYAMSRFKLPTSYKVLLFLMLTMAFPPMVMGIPNFLMLKRLNLLNTFWALVLPTAANGYFIFLLKGFFDSLPKELFECATLDGASEWQIFWNIAMALSKPIMAVIALNAFNMAYRNFMFAFIVCQDQRMWTMMVHIYQLMQRSCQGVGFAALVIAAIPVFMVFVFCQNIIIRGIVVPTEK